MKSERYQTSWPMGVLLPLLLLVSLSKLHAQATWATFSGTSGGSTMTANLNGSSAIITAESGSTTTFIPARTNTWTSGTYNGQTINDPQINANGNPGNATSYDITFPTETNTSDLILVLNDMIPATNGAVTYSLTAYSQSGANLNVNSWTTTGGRLGGSCTNGVNVVYNYNGNAFQMGFAPAPNSGTCASSSEAVIIRIPAADVGLIQIRKVQNLNDATTLAIGRVYDQLFTDVSSLLTAQPGVSGLQLGSVAWGDYDNDGKLDLLASGDIGYGGRLIYLYHNTGSGFAETHPFPGMYNTALDWGDYDNDGRLDLMIIGEWGHGYESILYHNTGTGFEEKSGLLPGLPNLRYGSVAWGDYDNDGKPDLLLTGQKPGDAATILYHNTGTGFEDKTSLLPNSSLRVLGSTNTGVDWGDYDNDGRLDLMFTGSMGPLVSFLFRNTGTGFEDKSSLLPNLVGISDSEVAWGDYDNDGKLDLILSGNSSSGGICQLYHNTGSGFEDKSSLIPNPANVSNGSAIWGDYNNDGRLDLFMTGGASRLYRNTGTGFDDASLQIPNLPNAGSSAAAWGDYDNDGKLDLVLTGYTSAGLTRKLYRNISSAANAAPTAPTSLTSTTSINGTSVTLTWAPATDDHTPSAGLNYNLYVSDSPQSQTVVGAMADINTGYRRVAQAGNSQPTSYTLTGLKQNKTYYWSVQAIDGSFTGSPFASQKSFLATPFLETTSQLPNLSNSSVAWGDYDNDGKLDLMLTGNTTSGPVSKLYHNTGTGFADQSSLLPNLPGVQSGAIAWGDYDNDGRLDLMLTGQTASGSVSRLYHNIGTGFDDQSSLLPALPNVANSAIAWGDYNNDGKLDLILTGNTGSGFVSRLYRNTGTGFTDQSSLLPSLPGIRNGSAAWGDYDNDGRPDLLLTGRASSGPVSYLYHNTGIGFENQSSLLPALPGMANSAIAWGDYDNDGKLDLILSGDTGSGYVSKLYHNTGTGFTDQSSLLPGLPGVRSGSVAWADCDNDGKLDLLLTGQTTSGFVSRLYHNTGTGFEDASIQLPNLPNVANSDVAWGDYNNDSKLDLLLTGDTGAGGVSKLYQNVSLITNTAPAAPTALSNTFNSSTKSAVFTWTAPTDDHTPSTALSYNLYVSDSPQAQTILSSMADRSTGYRRVVRLGNSQPTSYTLTGLELGKVYYWSVQALDGAFAGSPFAPQQTLTTPAFRDASSQLPNLPQVGFSAVDWGDYDNDGKLDLILTGSTASGYVSKLYHNTGSGFDDQSSLLPNLPGVQVGALAWGDYDNDGRLDLILTGRASSGPVSKLYHNTSAGFDDQSNLIPNLPQVRYSSVAWGDYDNDGKLDLLLTGDTGAGYVSKLYHNTGTGFEDKSSVIPGLPAVAYSTVAWGDYDNDGKLDFLLIGLASGGGKVNLLYHNTGSGFENKISLLPGLSGVYESAMAWGDYDNDGKLDLIVTGTTSGYFRRLYHNTGTSFEDKSSLVASLPYLSNGSVDWGDYDSDGKLDLVITGLGIAGRISKLYRNTGTGFEDQTAQVPGLPGTRLGAIAWGDYDNDGKLDLLLTGDDNSGGTSKLYYNIISASNVAPTAPSSLTSTPSPDGKSVYLSWAPPTDDHTPSGALSYNLYVSDSPQSQTVVSAMADQTTGYRRIVRLGNSRPTSFTLTGLSQGRTYYWSVQALDASFAGSPFANPQSFSITHDLTPMLYTFPSIAYGPTSFSVVVDVAELTGIATVDLITLKITRDSRVSLTLPSSETSVGNRLVQNAVWSLNSADPSYYVLTTNAVIAGGEKLSVGLTGQLNPGATAGTLAVSSVLVDNHQGEAKLGNNTDADKVDYFPQ